MSDAQPPAPAASQPAAPLTQAEDKQWASFAHFGGVVGILPTLIIYLVFKDRGALTKQEAKEALNWQITFTIGYIVLSILVAILQGVLIAAGVFGALAIVGFIPWLLWILNAILSILGGVKVQGGGAYRYPFALRLVK
ncbi:MAG: DUF4870 domain-containing protein [Rhodoglobus sp.]